MSRRRAAVKREVLPDAKFGDHIVTKFINCLMYQGKKATAMRCFYGALDQIKKRMPDVEPIDVFTQAVEHVKPTATGERVTRFNALFHWAVPAGREDAAGRERLRYLELGERAFH